MSRDQTAAEAVANESVPPDAEGLRLTDGPMLSVSIWSYVLMSPPPYVAAEVTDFENRPEMFAEHDPDFQADSSVDEIIALADE